MWDLSHPSSQLIVLFFIILTPDISFSTLCLPKVSRPQISSSGYQRYLRFSGDSFTCCKKVFFFHTTSKTITYIWRSSFCLEPFQGRLVNHQPRLKPRHREVHRERECLKFLIILKILFLTQVFFEVTVLSFIQIFRHVKVQILIDRCWIKLPRSFNVSEEE